MIQPAIVTLGSEVEAKYPWSSVSVQVQSSPVSVSVNYNYFLQDASQAPEEEKRPLDRRTASPSLKVERTSNGQ